MALTNQWLLTSNAVDSVGGLVTTNNGGVTFSPTKGASLNGINQWLSFTKDLPVSFSISFWVNIPYNIGDPYPTMAPIIANNSTGNSLTGVLFSGIHTDGYPSGFNSIRGSYDFNTTNYPISSFVFVNLDFDSITLRLYRNNIMLASASRQLSNVSSTWSIGRNGLINNYYFKGNIMDVRFFNNNLNDSERSAIVSAGPTIGIVIPPQRPQCIGGF